MKQKLFQLLLGGINIFVPLCAFSQQAPLVIQPSPQSKLFERYDTPAINLNRGTQEINIPLYEIEIKGMKVPINLSYSGGGIRYKQYNGEIAVGWVLNPGYRVNRNICARPDEQFNMASGNLYDQMMSRTAELPRDKYLATLANDHAEPNTPEPEGYNFYDSQFDQFSYVLPGSNGHFIIKDRTSGVTEMLEKDNLQVVFPSWSAPSGMNEIKELKITDENGFKYNFGKSTENISIAEKSGSYNTSWPLMDIISPYNSNEQIHFKYQTTAEYTLDNNQKQIYTITDALHVTDVVSNPSLKSVSYIGFNYKSTFFIQEINTTNEIIKFTRENNGSGINQYRLQKIEIFKRSSMELIKQITFSYIYTDPHYLLTTVQIADAQGVVQQVYRFDYYPGVNPYDYYADQWGYYHTGGSGVVNTFGTYHQEFKDDEFQSETYIGGLSKINTFTPGYLKEKDQNLVTCDAYSIKSVTYPTGGRVEYEYEPNQYFSNLPSKPVATGGGIRIKKVLSYSGTGNPLQRLYKYGANEDGFGMVSFAPNYNSFKTQTGYIEYYPTGNLGESMGSKLIRDFSTEVTGDVSMESDFSISYPEVSVYEYDQANARYNGKEVYKYISKFSGDYREMYHPSFQTQFSSLYNDLGVYINSYNFWRKSLLSSQSSYAFVNNAYSILKKQDFEYETSSLTTFTGMKVKQSVYSNRDYITGNTSSGANWPYNYGNGVKVTNSFFSYLPYEINSGKDLLKKKIETDYTAQGTVITSTTFNYNSLLQLSEKNSTSSNGNATQTKYKYPKDKVLLNQDPAGIYQGMLTANIVEPIIEEQKMNKGTQIELTNNAYYSPYAGLYVPQFKSVQTLVNSEISKINFTGYDGKGNLTEVQPEFGVKTVYLWGYNSQYPVAKIVGSNYTAVSSIISQSQIDAATSIPNNDQALRSLLNSLRSGITNAQVWTYTYAPLIGMTSETDPKGQTIYYEYDDFQRLKNVKDRNGDVIKNTTYHYKP